MAIPSPLDLEENLSMISSRPQTIHFNDVSQVEWDVVVVGAGPAGSLAAHQLASLKLSVLLIDKAQFPRRKVCGSCLNEQSLRILKSVGFNSIATNSSAPRLREMRLASKKCEATVTLSGGISLSRERLDTQMVEEGIRAGVQFLPGTWARLGDVKNSAREVELRQADRIAGVRARVVLVGDGLAGGALPENSRLRSRVAKRSRMGVGTIVEEGPAFYKPGVVYMACGRHGYVGAVRLEDGQLDIAGAIDPSVLKRGIHIEEVVSRILDEAGFPPILELNTASWQGTPALTRRRGAICGERFFVIGDSAGYAEPFTGEGMALTSGRAVASIARDGVMRWEHSLLPRWEHEYERLISDHQRPCKIVAAWLKHPVLTQLAVELFSRIPRLSTPIVKLIQGA
jgi:menaquinone-9 beta-reductase